MTRRRTLGATVRGRPPAPNRAWGVTVLAAAVATGVAAGVAATLLTLLLHAIQRAAFGYTEDTFLTGVEKASDIRRVLALTIGGVVAGVGWYALRRWSRRNVSVTHALSASKPDLPLLETTLDAIAQLVAVGAGGSLGREGAPRQVGAALAAKIGRGLSYEQHRMLIAAGAGAGLADAYNVPFAGVAFALEILLTAGRRAAFLPTLACCGVATIVSWPILGRQPTYHLTGHESSPVLYGLAPLLGVVGAGFGIGFRRLMTYARTRASAGWGAAAAIPLTFAALGASAIPFPQLLGNGKNLAELALTGSVGIGLSMTLTLLKPLATAACLRSGAIGGLLTPSFATGATLGAAVTFVVPAAWGVPAGAVALLGAASVFAVVQRAPWTAAVLTLDLCHPTPALTVPVLIAVASATWLERRLHSKHQRAGIQ